MNMKQKIARKIKCMFDPVDQDHDALLFRHHKGRAVRLRPVLSPYDPTRIERWVLDPLEVMAVERMEGGQR